MKRVVIVAFDGCQALDVIGPNEVFCAAESVRRELGAKGEEVRCEIVGIQRPIMTSSGVCLVPGPWPRGAIDTMVVAGGAGARGAAEDARLVRNIAAMAKRARRVASVCTGAFVLAAAGLLDGKRATTHWAACEALAKRHPRVTVERDPIYVKDGRVWTSAGVTAGIDLALAMVEEDLGREVANLVAKWLVVFVRRAGGQAQFSAQLSAQAAERDPLRDLQAWIVEHPDAALDVPALARRVGMSGRHFARVFHAEVGLTPAAYVERVRVETARRLLETTARSIEDVATRAGFGTPAALRRAFARRLGLTPREYRNRFGEGTHP